MAKPKAPETPIGPKSNILINFLILLVLAVGGAAIVDYGLHAYFTTTVFVYLAAAAAILAGALLGLKKITVGQAAAIFFGLLLIPYVQFFVGRIDVFAMDPPELRESVNAKVVRVVLGEIQLTNDKGEQVTIIKDLTPKNLYPGANEIRLGTLDIPAGSYKGVHVAVQSVEVDLEIDLAKEAELDYAQLKDSLPALSEPLVKKAIKDRIVEVFNSEQLKALLPKDLLDLKNVQVSGDILSFTLAINPPPIDVPVGFPYPTGTGGPDVTIDIILNPLGLPTGIKPIIHLPPGVPEINIPAVTAGDQIPSDFSALIAGQATANMPCSDAASCMTYCKEPGRAEECAELAGKFGIQLPSTPGGCKSQAECATYCAQPEHLQECQQFLGT